MAIDSNTQTESDSTAARNDDQPADILPPEHWARVTAEYDEAENGDDADSAFGNDLESTASLTSTILNYRKIHGRTYHSDVGNAEYWGANDERQSETLDLYHHAHSLLLGDKLFLAPIKDDVKKVLDIGTGTGGWAIDFADMYPNAQVIGTDISKIQPSWVPPNCEFQIDDCTQPWTFESNSIDYIHMRVLNGSVADWDFLMAEAYRCLKPGGWLESMEASPHISSDDGSLTERHAWSQWGNLFEKAGKSNGRSWNVIEDGVQEKSMAKAGLKDLVISKYKTPISPWPQDPRLREVGQYVRFALSGDLEGLALYAATVLGDWTMEEIQVWFALLRRELRNTKIHAYHWDKVVYGQKPEA